MKKLILLFITMTLCFGMFCTTALGAPAVKVTVDGKAIAFTDAKPFVDEKNRTQVPMRALGEALGCNVDYINEYNYEYDYWDEHIELTKTTANGLKVCAEFYPDSPEYSINFDDFYFNTYSADTETKIIKNRTYLPARYVAETFGYTVNWDAKNNTVIIKNDPNSNLNITPENLTKEVLVGKWEVYDIYDNEYIGTIQFSQSGYLTFNLDWYYGIDPYTVNYINSNFLIFTSAFADFYISDPNTEYGLFIKNENIGIISIPLEGGKGTFKIVKRESVDISKYNSFLSTYKKNIEELYIYDVNKDNVNDLIIYTGTCEADYEYEVYTVKNSNVIKMGTIPGSQSVLYGNSAKPGLVLQYAHMGYEEIFEVTYANNTFNLKSVYQNEIDPEEDYSIPKNSIELTPIYYDWWS